MLIEFRRHERVESQAWIHRPDGVVVWLPSYTRKYRIPHDLAHVVTERELGMARGVFGSIASGGRFSNGRVVRGRPRHDARKVSDRAIRQGWGVVNQDPFPWTREDITRATEALRDLGKQWVSLGPAETLEITWPRRLVLPPPR